MFVAISLLSRARSVDAVEDGKVRKPDPEPGRGAGASGPEPLLDHVKTASG